jgi:hypothetical protein
MHYLNQNLNPMKRLFLISLCTVLICFSVSAQKDADAKVPAALKISFAKLYPKAMDVKWEKEGANWEVAFKNLGKEMTVALDKKGVVTETEVPIVATELPAIALRYLAEKFKGKPILSVDKITASTKVSYEVVVQKGKALMFDANGKYLSTGKD